MSPTSGGLIRFGGYFLYQHPAPTGAVWYEQNVGSSLFVPCIDNNFCEPDLMIPNYYDHENYDYANILEMCRPPPVDLSDSGVTSFTNIQTLRGCPP